MALKDAKFLLLPYFLTAIENLIATVFSDVKLKFVAKLKCRQKSGGKVVVTYGHAYWSHFIQRLSVSTLPAARDHGDNR